ncbi:CoA transferase [Cupriavidus sp. TA19]|uniref:CaiB/BaiF CoA transferase family protein n=1 Tax=Cupriavidus sp. TA19 TaxID=701108 RepID=UPI002729414A|nr:CoA transferase [Cupriavidus sp. TA19]GLC91803.1 CoA transferase [Cupriavidus sp. TA19]
MKDDSKDRRGGPLSRVRVLDLGTMVAAPVAATLFADFGADVIKVEQPGTGDTLRGVGPFYEEECLWWQVEGRNKKSVTIDLRQPEGQALLKKLVEKADVVMENFRPGTLEKWGVGYSELSAVNPALVMLSISGFGQTGPNAQRGGYDRIALAFSGVMAMTGYPDRAPVRIGTSMADYSTATMGAFAVMMALYHRDLNGGIGQQIDLALYEPVFRFTDSMVPAYDKLGRKRERTGNVHSAAAPGSNFETKDGRFMTLTISGDSLFRKLCQAMERPDMADDSRYATHVKRWEHITDLNEVVAHWIRETEFALLSDTLTNYGIPFSLALTIEEIMEDPHFEARGNIETVQHPELGPIKMPGIVPKMLGTPAEPIQPAPSIGQDNEEIFTGLLGIDAEEYRFLRRRKVI